MARSAAEQAALERAKARLDTLDWYPRPVRLRRTVRVVHAPWVFRLPVLRRFRGYTAWDLILLKRPLGADGDDLVVHELCHVWQMQHHPVRMPLSFVWEPYSRNRYELQARRSVEATRHA